MPSRSDMPPPRRPIVRFVIAFCIGGCAMASLSWAQSPRTAAAAVATEQAIWAAQPAGPQPLPNLPSLTLLESIGDLPLTDASRGPCLLVARRENRVIAIELKPLVDGPKLKGWTPKVIDNDTLVSSWHYKAPEWTQGSAFQNPATQNMSNSTTVSASSTVSGMARDRSVVSSSAKTWSTAGKDAKGNDVTRKEAAATVTIDGKTYSRYTNFQSASTDVSTSSFDDYLCQR